MNSFPDKQLLPESYQLYIIAKYKARSVVKLDQIGQIYFFASSLWNQQNSRSNYFWLHLIEHGLPLDYDKIVVKHDDHRKIFVTESLHIAI